MQPKISVIIPVYNAGLYLRECLDSVVDQTLKEIEIICVDDGSQDDSILILEEYAASDKRFTILKQTHQFAGVARNNGMQIAQGEYLLFLDSDDYFDRQMLEKSYQRAKAFEADICVFRAQAIDQQTGVINDFPATCRLLLAPKDVVFSRKSNPRNIYCFTTPAPWNKLFRKAFLQQQGLCFQPIQNTNDLLFVILALSTAERIITLDECLLTYRTNTGTSLQATLSNDPLIFYNSLTMLKEELITRGIFNKLEQNFINLALNTCRHNLHMQKTQESFETVYYFLRNEAFPTLKVNDKNREYFYAYAPDNFDCQNDINRLEPSKYIKKYGLLQAKNKKLNTFYWLRCKLRGGLHCIREYGIIYTLKLFFQKLYKKVFL